MKIETVKDGIRYTLSNDDLKINDMVFPIASGRCIDKDYWILHGFSFDEYLTGFPNRPHTIIDLDYSPYKPEQVRTTSGFGPIEIYFKVIKTEIQVIANPEAMFKTYKWVETKYPQYK